MAFKKNVEDAVVRVVAPRSETIAVKIRGTADYVMHRMAAKAVNLMKAKMEQGDQAKTTKKREARDFKADYEDCFHRSEEGWPGIPAMGFKAGMLDVCGDTGAVASKIKRNVWIEVDGIDPRSRNGLIKITSGEPTEFLTYAMNGGFGKKVADLRNRPRWDAGWEATIRITFNPDIVPRDTVVNLLATAGRSIGVGEGRNGSKMSVGQGWGSYEVVSNGKAKA